MNRQLEIHVLNVDLNSPQSCSKPLDGKLHSFSQANLFLFKSITSLAHFHVSGNNFLVQNRNKIMKWFSHEVNNGWEKSHGKKLHLHYGVEMEIFSCLKYVYPHLFCWDESFFFISFHVYFSTQLCQLNPKLRQASFMVAFFTNSDSCWVFQPRGVGLVGVYISISRRY